MTHSGGGLVPVGNSGVLHSALSYIGIGKVPLSVLMLSFCLIWGSSGMVSLEMFSSLPGSLGVLPAMGVAGTAAFFLTGMAARLIHRIMPTEETHTIPRQKLVFETARVRFRLTPTSGEVTLTDPLGTLRNLPCRVESYEAEIPAGQEVVLYRYDRERDVFYAALLEDEEDVEKQIEKLYQKVQKVNKTQTSQKG